MNKPPVQNHVVIDGKAIKITRLPSAVPNLDSSFDRHQFDSGRSPDIGRADVLAHKDFDQPLYAHGRRVTKKKQAE